MKDNGVLFDCIDPVKSASKLTEWKTTRNLQVEKTILIHPGLKNIRAILDFSSQIHHHLTDEIWFVTEGRGLMEIDANDGHVMQCHLEPGDLILIPAFRHHRFIAPSDSRFSFVRLLPDISGWRSIYRRSIALAVA